MAAHLFNESGQMQEVDIPDIFDVLAGGEDESAVKFLLGFSAEDEAAAALMADSAALSINPGLHHMLTNVIQNMLNPYTVYIDMLFRYVFKFENLDNMVC